MMSISDIAYQPQWMERENSSRCMFWTESVTRDIAKEVASVNEASGDIAQSAEAVQASSESLSGLARDLNAMVGKFRI